MLSSIIIGFLAGYIASKLQSGDSKGLIINLFLGVIGGYVGGWLFDLVGIETYTWLGQLICGVIGAAIVLWVFAKIRK
ncbi:MAG: GlsB/YeaQ/YmgE family stress response membrane protein [Bacteroidales bacterium]|nr:GlsB/YeaQ/YmgE family stress response membrane protein [Bacteroidales bacterium]